MSPRPTKSEKDSDKLLTEAELELMNILWKRREASVHEVMEDLPSDRELAYTSVSTILRILEQKNILKSRKEGRAHLYAPILKKEDYEARSLKHLVTHVFDDTPTALVRQLLSSVELSESELLELKKILREKER